MTYYTLSDCASYIEEYTGMYHRELNRELRSQDLSERGAFSLRGILKELKTCKTYKGKVYRGTSRKSFQSCLDGKIFCDEGFLSSSKDPIQGQSFCRGGNKRGIFLTIISKTGKSVEEVSAIPLEKEVLFKPGTKFRVKNSLLGHLTGSYTLEEI